MYKPVFPPISTDWLCLQHAQTPRTRDLAIFVPTTTTTTTTDGQTDCFTPCACAWGNNKPQQHYINSKHTYIHSALFKLLHLPPLKSFNKKSLSIALWGLSRSSRPSHSGLSVRFFPGYVLRFLTLRFWFNRYSDQLKSWLFCIRVLF